MHIEVCDLSDDWPRLERFELTGQVRRSSNSSPDQLAEKHDDRHIKNKIEGVNGAGGEVGEAIHHLYIASLNKYNEAPTYISLKGRYKECVRMLNGMERSLERQLPKRERRWFTPEP
ncbi:MAG: hypothetical protein CME19_07595 [Gemmatimonadetes bacterium]|nr:hypothetical protein [Gemmatimonadota bacterium]